ATHRAAAGPVAPSVLQARRWRASSRDRGGTAAGWRQPVGRSNGRTPVGGRQAAALFSDMGTHYRTRNRQSEPGRPMSNDDCPVCAELAGRIAAPGGAVYRNAWWEVAHHTGAHTDPGELIVKARRHVESMSGLTEDEAASLGPVLRAAVTAIERVVRPERVYVASYGERVRHLHFFLLPRTASLPAGHVVSDVYRRARSQL